MPGTVIGSSLSFVGEAWIGATDTAGGAVQPQRHVNTTPPASPRLTATVKPIAFPNPSTPRPASTTRIAGPQRLANNQTIQPVATLRFTKPIPYPNTPVIPPLATTRNAKPQPFTNTPLFPPLRLTLKLSPAAYANSAVLRAAAVAVATPAAKQAPHRPSTVQVFAPAVNGTIVTTVTATLNLSGWTPNAPKRRATRAPSTWPNLPNVEAPPWRLTVVTPETARERARAQIASRNRTNLVRRKRRVAAEADAIFRDLVEEEIVRTIVDVAAAP